MKEKKHIDQLFQERFQDFEATPPPAVWDQLEAQLLAKKKERRVIPIWWRVAGVAALIALLFTAGLSLFNTTSPATNVIVVEGANEKNTPETTHEEHTKFKEKIIKNEPQLGTDQSEGYSTDINSATVTNQDKVNASENASQDASITKEKIIGTIPPSKTSVAETSNPSNQNSKNLKRNSNKDIESKNASTNYNTKREAVATSNKPKKATQKSSETTYHPLVKDPKTVVSGNEAVATNPMLEDRNNSIKPSKETLKLEKDEDNKRQGSESIAQETPAPIKKSIFDAIEENKQLEDAVDAQEQAANRWAVTPTVGPVYYNSLSGGSSIDPMFSDNSQKGNVTLSYGVAVDYSINKKISVRSGVNNVNLSYATGDVQVVSAPPEFALKNINYGSSRNAITTVFDKDVALPTTETDGFGGIVPKATNGNAEISQQLQYYEVPLELTYALVSKKVSIHLIGGMSTLFLGSNEIIVNDGDFRTVLGEANNLNSVSFTSNVGLGFNYQLSKNFRFNIEPMFKYQLNPYTDSSIDFKPYYLGVYSGLSFKF